MNGRIVKSDQDCADCLCRVCARNQYNESWNPNLEQDYKGCIPCECCHVGETLLVDIDSDCPTLSFLADYDDLCMEETDGN